MLHCPGQNPGINAVCTIKVAGNSVITLVATLSMKGLFIMDLILTFMYFMPMLTVIFLGGTVLMLAYNVYLDRKTHAYAGSARSLSMSNMQPL